MSFFRLFVFDFNRYDHHKKTDKQQLTEKMTQKRMAHSKYKVVFERSRNVKSIFRISSRTFGCYL